MYHAWVRTQGSRATAAATATVLGGILLGAILGALGRWAYLILLTPALLGVGAGALAGKMFRTLRVPHRGISAAAGAVAASCGMASLLWVALQMVQAVAVEAAAARGLSDAAAAGAVAARMAELTGGGGLLGLRLQSGVTLVSGVAVDLGRTLNGLILAADVATAVALAGWLGFRGASGRFCVRCDRWYVRRIIGSMPLGARTTALAALDEGRYHRLGRQLDDPRAPQAVKLHGRFCDTCDTGDVVLELEVTLLGSRAEVVRRMVVPHSALDEIMESQALKRG